MKWEARNDTMTKPTFSILVDDIDNTNLAIKQLRQIAIEEGILTEEDFERIRKRKKELDFLRESTND